MKKFNSLNSNVPFVQSDNYNKEKGEYSNPALQDYADKLNRDGFCVLNLDINNSIIDTINFDIETTIKKNNFKKNSDAYHYNDSPRIVEAWKYSESIKKVVFNKKLNNLLTYCYNSNPIPISTINFLKGAEQPLHSDEFHFGSIPHGFITGCWVALEDILDESGPLTVVKGSHKLPLFSFEEIDINIPKSESEFKEAYSKYEDWVKAKVEENDLEVISLPIKKGECIIWLGNSLHGSIPIKNEKLSRKSMAIHYHYEKCNKIFYPSYSNLRKNKFVYRSIEDIRILK